MIMARRQISTALAAAEIDGVARRIVLCTPGLATAYVETTMRDAQVDAVIVDDDLPEGSLPEDMHLGGAGITVCPDQLQPVAGVTERDTGTEWVLLTSGTTGLPKLALHSLESLVAPIGVGVPPGDPVWSTFYDIRRYGGLQILLRALVGGGSMVLSDASEPVDAFLARAGAEKVTHISGTPSHWRRVLMSAAAGCIAPGYLRLSGEACDQAVLDRLKLAYPRAAITHAFASTEAGVGFNVKDGLAGFPASLIGPERAGVQMRVEDGSLRIRSSRTASGYLGDASGKPLPDRDGFVDTGDLLELRDKRYYFIGRRGGVINVGGFKVHPEAVEAVINEHPAVHASRVSGRASPIIGALVVAEIVMKQVAAPGASGFVSVRRELLELCRNRLPCHQVPMNFREVGSLEVASSGKMTRLHA